jgi:hypothetical protein
MGRPFDLHHFVTRERQSFRLQTLLKAGFGVLGNAPLLRLRHLLRKQPLNQIAAAIHSGIQVHRADESLQGIRQNRVTIPAAALEFASPKLQRYSQTEFARNCRQCVTANEQRPQAGQLPLSRIGLGAVQIFRSDEINNGIAEELEALVMPRSGASMSKRAVEQRLVLENVPQTAEKLSSRVIHFQCTDLASK